HPVRRKLARLVAHHRLADEHRHVLAAVVHGDRVADHLRKDRGGARPGLEHALLAALVHLVDALHQPLLDPRALFRGPTHPRLPSALSAAAAAHDVAVGGLALLARAVAQRRHPPGGDRMAAGRGLALAAAVGVVDRVHRGATRLRADALVAVPARLPDRDVLVVRVADRADRGATHGEHHPHLAGGEPQRRVAALLGDELDRGAGGTAELATTAGRE